jgi:hypothetical protein
MFRVNNDRPTCVCDCDSSLMSPAAKRFEPWDMSNAVELCAVQEAEYRLSGENE